MMQQINLTHTSTKKSEKYSADIDSSRLESWEQGTVSTHRQVSSDYQLRNSRPHVYI